jgi:hypothetical protein
MRREGRGDEARGERREARGDAARGARREARGDAARGVAGCTLHVERGTTTWRGAAALRPDRQRGPSRGRREARGDAARGARREARGDAARGVAGCTLHVERGTTTWRGAAALRRAGMRRAGLQVARCTLNVGRPRGGAQRRCGARGWGEGCP